MQYNINYMKDTRRDLTMHSHLFSVFPPLHCYLFYVGRSQKDEEKAQASGNLVLGGGNVMLWCFQLFYF